MPGADDHVPLGASLPSSPPETWPEPVSTGAPPPRPPVATPPTAMAPPTADEPEAVPPPRRSPRWWLVVAVPAVILLVALVLGDQRRWPVIGAAAVADGTGLAIAPPPADAGPDHRQVIERVSADGIERITVDELRGPEQAAELAGSPTGWTAIVAFAWDDGQPDGRSLWVRPPDGPAVELGPFTDDERLVGIDDEGTVVTIAEEGAVLRWQPRRGEPTELAATDALQNTSDDDEWTAAGLDPASGEVAGLVQRSAGADRPPAPEVVRVGADGQVAARQTARTLSLVGSITDDGVGQGDVQVVVAGEVVRLVGRQGTVTVLPEVGDADPGQRQGTDGPGVALTPEGDLVTASPVGIDRPGGRSTGPSAAFEVAGERGIVREDHVRAEVLGRRILRPVGGAAPWLLLLAGTIVAVGLGRAGSESARRWWMAASVGVGAAASAHLVLQVLWGWPLGLVAAAVTAIGAGTALAAIPLSPPAGGTRPPGQRLVQGTRDPEPRALPAWPIAIPAGLAVAVVLAAAVAGDQGRAPFVGLQVSGDGQPYLAEDRGGATVVGVLEGEVYVRQGQPGTPAVDASSLQVAPDGTAAFETEGGEPGIVVIGVDSTVREVDAPDADLLGIDADGTVVVGEDPARAADGSRSGRLEVVRIGPDGERTEVAEIDVSDGLGTTVSDPETGLLVISAFVSGDGQRPVVEVTTVPADGSEGERWRVDLDQIGPRDGLDQRPVVGGGRVGLLGDGGYLELAPIPGATRPIDLDRALDDLFVFGAPAPWAAGAALSDDGTLLLGSPWAEVAPDGEVTYRTLDDCDDQPLELADSCGVEVAGRPVPRPWTMAGTWWAAGVAFAAATVAAVAPRRSGTRVVAIVVLGISTAWSAAAVVRLNLWDGRAAPTDDIGVGGGADPLPVGLPTALFVLVTVGAAVALITSERMRSWNEGRRAARPSPLAPRAPR